jgi:malonate-semialdehyde dehydrogenase (acetylating)/methylmalonate-semialdehyde dehydrogenase
MFKFKQLVERNIEELALPLSSEHGEVIADAKGDVQRGPEVIEFACGIPHALKGEYTQGASPGIDVCSMRQPRGIVVGIKSPRATREPSTQDNRQTGRFGFGGLVVR